MGNSHSTSTSRRNTSTSERTINQSSTSNTPTNNDVSGDAKTEDRGKASNATRQRRSMLKFPSLRRNSRIVAGNDEATSSDAIVEPPLSRRRWKRLSSFKPRPVSTTTTPSSILPGLNSSSSSSSSSGSGNPVDVKGKGKEQEIQHSNAADERVEEERQISVQAVTPFGGNEVVAAEEQPEAISDTLIQDLRHLQSEESKGDNEYRPSDRPPTPIPISAEDSQDVSRAEVSEALGSWLGGRSPSQTQNQGHSGNRTPQSSTLAESHPPVSSPRSSSRSRSLPNIPRANPDTSNRPALSSERGHRPLPPTGTGAIVVVQGVVHTTDTPLRSADLAGRSRPAPRPTPSAPLLRTSRNMSSSHSRSSTPQPSSLSRLSAFTEPFRSRSRPSTSGSHRSAANPLPSESHSQASNHFGEQESDGSVSLRAPSDVETSSTALTEPSSSVAAVVSTQERSSETLSPPDGTFGEPRPPGTADHAPFTGNDRPSNDSENTFDEESDSELSASSIEVLGTLLSVATAATAASLVSGTTEPLFSSGLAAGLNPLADNGDDSPPEPFLSRDRDSADPRNTRIRNAWDTLRDRLRGRRRRTEGTRDSGETSESQLLRQMAQTLNLELDRSGNGPDSSLGASTSREGGEGGSTENTDASQNGGRTLPPDGTFDRFLYNLQEDLRTALVEDYAARRARGRNQQSRVVNRPEEPAAEPLTTETAPAAGPSTAGESSLDTEISQREPSTSQSTAIDGSDAIPASSVETKAPGSFAATAPESETPIADYPPTPRTAHLDLPPLPAAVDQSPDDSNLPQQAQGITGQPGAGINWWRLYRFPPMAMVSPDSDGQNDTNANANPSASSPSISTSSDPISPLQDGPMNAPVPTTPGSPPTQHVVPVIVVGLQSVPPSRQLWNVEREQRGSPTPEGMADMGSFSPPDQSDSSVRDRVWPLRAASRAFNRIGRRGEHEEEEGGSRSGNTTPTNPTEGEPQVPERRTNGGRTYLIFVIGGYYPPNHSLVTGADDMNSFEALWELAELIGQVKPPVASKEDIEKSGLPVFKASGLAEYESNGKVAANTIENCLICLEPYGPDEDLRLLSCRHAFHQECVDKWLEQGRNNCPVCRSLGAFPNTDEPTESSSSTTDA